MYLNEESWHAQQENSYVIDEKIRNFLDIYALIKRKNPRKEIFVSEDEEILVDEMLAILSDRNQIIEKKESEHAQAVISEMYRKGL